jgi:HPt (histidine-containing phosphotransfer) domain-containing protein
MIDLSNPAFRAVLERFKVRLRENRERLGKLESAIAPDADDVLAEIRPIAHRLAGSAGTFGFAHLGASAMRLDRLLSEGCREPEIARAHLRQLLAAIDGCENITEG